MIWQESVGPKSQTRTGRLRKLVLMPDIKIKAHFIELSHRTENLRLATDSGLFRNFGAALWSWTGKGRRRVRQDTGP